MFAKMSALFFLFKSKDLRQHSHVFANVSSGAGGQIQVAFQSVFIFLKGSWALRKMQLAKNRITQNGR